MLRAFSLRNVISVLNENNGGESKMSYDFSQKSKERFLSIFSAGVFFIILGVVFVGTPGLIDNTIAFFQDFKIVRVPKVSFEISLPAPANPGNYSNVYSAAALFCFSWGIFLAVLLGLRLFARSPLKKKADATSDIVFWLVGGFLINNFLNATTTHAMWFSFWAAIVVLIGVTLIIRAAILAIFR